MLSKENAKKIGVIKEKLHAGKEMYSEVAEMATIVNSDEGGNCKRTSTSGSLKTYPSATK
ncbi:hypothetical protein ACWFRC_01360 [Bacillus cereus]